MPHAPRPWTFMGPTQKGPDWHGEVIDANGLTVCEFTGPHREDVEQRLRPIAAAPDMLAILQQIDAHGYGSGEYDVVKAAIAKASNTKGGN